MKHVSKILHSGHTVFTYDFLQDILGISNKNTLKGIVKTLLKREVLVKIHPGYWGLPWYNHEEFASKLKSPSYITCETVLQQEAVIFQDYSSSTTLVWNNTTTLKIGKHSYHYRKMKYEILLDPLGIKKTKTRRVASKERAICDMLYYVTEYHFDHIGAIDKDLMKALALLYPSTTATAIYSLIDKESLINLKF